MFLVSFQTLGDLRYETVTQLFVDNSRRSGLEIEWDEYAFHKIYHSLPIITSLC